ncbi:MAG: DUF1211 domain-containing protein [Planctomycetes bacterium]|nr:DUF1211 domain-containing protein [Planctomycetota bacterium]
MTPELSTLRVQDGFRLRGESISRLETFVDAAFAFAVTMMVISVGTLPGSVPELLQALHRVPTFALCFLILMLFWSGHNRWSRRYGLDSSSVTLWSLVLVLVVLIWLYPLRMVIGGGMYFVTGGWVPSDMQATSVGELQDCFVIYGVGFAVLSAVMIQLQRLALAGADELQLDPLERNETRRELGSYVILLAFALASIALTFVVRLQSSPLVASLPGFLYSGIGPAMHFHHARFHRLRRQLAPRAG